MKKYSYKLFSRPMTEKFIEDKMDKVSNDIFLYITQSLSEDFIERHKNKLNWEMISKYQNLSEDFIRRHKDRVVWKYISAKQTLSIEFIKEFLHSIDWESFFYFRDRDYCDKVISALKCEILDDDLKIIKNKIFLDKSMSKYTNKSLPKYAVLDMINK